MKGCFKQGWRHESKEFTYKLLSLQQLIVFQDDHGNWRNFKTGWKMQELENNISNKYLETLVLLDAQEDHKELDHCV